MTRMSLWDYLLDALADHGGEARMDPDATARVDIWYEEELYYINQHYDRQELPNQRYPVPNSVTVRMDMPTLKRYLQNHFDDGTFTNGFPEYTYFCDVAMPIRQGFLLLTWDEEYSQWGTQLWSWDTQKNPLVSVGDDGRLDTEVLDDRFVCLPKTTAETRSRQANISPASLLQPVFEMPPCTCDFTAIDENAGDFGVTPTSSEEKDVTIKDHILQFIDVSEVPPDAVVTISPNIRDQEPDYYQVTASDFWRWAGLYLYKYTSPFAYICVPLLNGYLSMEPDNEEYAWMTNVFRTGDLEPDAYVTAYGDLRYRDGDE